MRIYLLRHGESIATGDDDLRPLSQQGEQDILRLAQRLTPLTLPIHHLWHSEKRRAEQTAELIVPAFVFNQSAIACHDLDPLAPIEPMLVNIMHAEGDCLIVGHMPLLGKLIAALITGNENQNLVNCKAGSITCLEQYAPRQWAIRWCLTPEVY